MSSLVSCRGKIVWKYNSGADDTFLGLTSITDATNIGRVINVVFDPEKTNSFGEFAWKEVKDPKKEPVEGEVLIIEAQEVSLIERFVRENTPKLTLIQKFTKKVPETTSLVQMLTATLPHLKKGVQNEVVFVW